MIKKNIKWEDKPGRDPHNSFPLDSLVTREVERLAEQKVAKEDKRIYQWIAKNGKVHIFFGRWLFIFADVKRPPMKGEK